jgi:hypothetical protein
MGRCASTLSAAARHASGRLYVEMTTLIGSREIR